MAPHQGHQALLEEPDDRGDGLLGLVEGVTLGAPGDVTHQTAEDEQQDEANGDDYLDL